jgi:hypothetical protein
VLAEPYAQPLYAETADLVVSNSCLEQSEMFWIVFLEVMRVFEPHGLSHLNVPSNGGFHRYPVEKLAAMEDPSTQIILAWFLQLHDEGAGNSARLCAGHRQPSNISSTAKD